MVSLHANISNTPFDQRSPQPPEEGVLNCPTHTNIQTDGHYDSITIFSENLNYLFHNFLPSFCINLLATTSLFTREITINISAVDNCHTKPPTLSFNQPNNSGCNVGQGPGLYGTNQPVILSMGGDLEFVSLTELAPSAYSVARNVRGPKMLCHHMHFFSLLLSPNTRS